MCVYRFREGGAGEEHAAETLGHGRLRGSKTAPKLVYIGV